MIPFPHTTIDTVLELEQYVDKLLQYTKSLKVEHKKLIKENEKLKAALQLQKQEIAELNNKLTVVSSAKTIKSDEEIAIIKQQIDDLIKILEENIALI